MRFALPLALLLLLASCHKHESPVLHDAAPPTEIDQLAADYRALDDKITRAATDLQNATDGADITAIKTRLDVLKQEKQRLEERRNALGSGSSARNQR